MKYVGITSIFSELRLVTECCLIAFLLCFFSAGAGAVSVTVDEPVFQQESMNCVIDLEMDEAVPINGRVQPAVRLNSRNVTPLPVVETDEKMSLSDPVPSIGYFSSPEPLHRHIWRILRNSLVVRAAP